MTIAICGWCPNVQARTAIIKAAGDVPSHGMCPACAKRMNDAIDAKEATLKETE